MALVTGLGHRAQMETISPERPIIKNISNPRRVSSDVRRSFFIVFMFLVSSYYFTTLRFSGANLPPALDAAHRTIIHLCKDNTQFLLLTLYPQFSHFTAVDCGTFEDGSLFLYSFLLFPLPHKILLSLQVDVDHL